MICAIPAAITSLVFTFMPESPRYLMSRGRNKEALKIFQYVHRMNTGKVDSYPVSFTIYRLAKILGTLYVCLIETRLL